MKLLISAAGENIESNIDITFHWASCFLIIDTLNNSLKSLENTIKNHPSKVGEPIDRLVKNERKEAVITYVIGSRVFEEFKKHGIKIYKGKGNIDEAIKQFEKGELSEIKNV